MVYYYFTVFPMEALIASELAPEEFGNYMAVGSKKGSAEQIIFMEITGGFESPFDWAYAEKQCVPHSNGEPKHSVYLSIYRVLEFIPLSAMGPLYLVTKDGRALKLEKSEFCQPKEWKGYGLYKELCPVNPLIVSSLNAKYFGKYLIDPSNKVSVPAIIFSDVRVIDLDDLEHSGNVGTMYDRKLDHLRACISDIQNGKGKPTKTVDRSFSSKFTYQIIDNGIYAAVGDDIICYAMPDLEELKEHHYDWAKSANIV